MSKDKISDYSATANSNTDIAGINIDEGCAPSGINNAIRTLMKQLKDFQQGTNSDSFNGPVGTTTPAAGAFTTITASGTATFNGSAVIGDADTDTITQAASYVTGTQLKSAKTATNTLNLAAYDVDGAAYTNLVTLTAGNTPTLDITSTGVGSVNNMSIGSTTAAAGAFTTLSASGVTTLSAGTASAPALTTSGDTNTGVLFPAADTVAVTTGGTERIRVDSSGNVGIGATSPSYKLNVAASGTAARIEVSNSTDSNRGGYIRDTGSAFELGTNSGTRPLAFATDATERARIDTSGNLLVGSSTKSYGEKLKAYSNSSTGNAAFFWQDNSADRDAVIVRNERASGATSATMISFMNANGSLSGKITATGSATAYVTSSDYRLKENIAPMTGALSVISQLKPCTYSWKVDGSAGQGFIAHELQSVVPDAVVGEKDAVDADGNPKYQGIDTSFLVATLTAAIQEQQAIIEQLKADVEALKAA